MVKYIEDEYLLIRVNTDNLGDDSDVSAECIEVEFVGWNTIVENSAFGIYTPQQRKRERTLFRRWLI